MVEKETRSERKGSRVTLVAEMLDKSPNALLFDRAEDASHQRRHRLSPPPLRPPLVGTR